MSAPYASQAVLDSVKIDPFAWRPTQRRRKLRHAAPSLAFLEAYHRCPECAAIDAANMAREKGVLDRVRDRALLRRDVNEALETIALEALGDEM